MLVSFVDYVKKPRRENQGCVKTSKVEVTKV